MLFTMSFSLLLQVCIYTVICYIYMRVLYISVLYAILICIYVKFLNAVNLLTSLTFSYVVKNVKYNIGKSIKKCVQI